MRLVPTGPQGGLLVVKAGAAFLVASPTGDIPAEAAAGEGFYSGDTRVLSELALTVGGVPPAVLASSARPEFRADVIATNAGGQDSKGDALARETIAIRRTLLIDEALHLQIEFESFLSEPIRLPIAISLAADFADVFDVRGVVRRPDRPARRPPELRDGAAVLGYRGEDGILVETIVETDGDVVLTDAGAEITSAIDLHPRGTRSVRVLATPALDGRRPRVRPFATAARALAEEADAWSAACTRITADDPVAEGVLEAAIADLHSLLTPTGGGTIPAAGIPWYVVPFGRDSILTAFSCLMLAPQLARDTLRVLAHRQARGDDPARDAEPGKILHELRSGELARAGRIPAPYYGTVDATPLFLALAAEYWRWTSDLALLAELRPALELALAWIDRHGDRDGDGFVEYAQRASFGLPNQGWKDSPQSIVHADGRRASGPIALVEVQGYVYMAKRGIADVLAALGDPDRAEALRAEAQRLRNAFRDAFWNPDEDTLVLALDGEKRRVASVTSNAGHCLWSGILDPDRARRVTVRLMADDMWSGWGVRTLSAENPAYNPMSYHNGSIWPHDNAIIAAGLRRYGHDSAAARIATAVNEIAATAPGHRIAELYCGFPRVGNEPIVPYPVACSPQAWAAAAPFMLLQATLGLSPDAPGNALAVNRPGLPAGSRRLALERLRVGRARVHCVITPDGADVRVTDGELVATVSR